MAVSRPIVFATDFGLRGEWVGICHAVMTRIAPSSPIVDLSHTIPPLDVLAGALLLTDTLPYMADDAVVVAVVDPKVGADRNIAIEAADGRLLVGPDNGLLMPACESLGGVRTAVEITSEAVILQPVAPSLHARDVLCPAAAHLAAGAGIAELGPQLDPGGLAGIDIPRPEISLERICCQALDVNWFGNVQLNVRQAHLEEAGLDDAAQLGLDVVSTSVAARRVQTYADLTPMEYGLMWDPRGWLTIVCGNPGNAAVRLNLQGKETVWLSRIGGTALEPAAAEGAAKAT
jgi:S-adenosyl-L-methionine hydrolase (adenosine-forming)